MVNRIRGFQVYKGVFVPCSKGDTDIDDFIEQIDWCYLATIKQKSARLLFNRQGPESVKLQRAGIIRF